MADVFSALTVLAARLGLADVVGTNYLKVSLADFHFESGKLPQDFLLSLLKSERRVGRR